MKEQNILKPETVSIILFRQRIRKIISKHKKEFDALA
jgi:hypothetical protein